jgi:hypothetical protein
VDGLLLTSIKDVSVLKDNKNLAGIACFYPIIQANKSIELEYFFDFYVDVIDYSIIGELASNWYRNGQGVDVISESEIMIGAILQSHLLIEFSNAIRYYFAFKGCLDKYDKILVSESIPDSLRMIANLFINKVEFFHSDNCYESYITVSPGTKVELPPVYKYFSMLLRFTQNFFTKYINNKVLIINDWTYRKVENSMCLNVNRFNPLRTFCISKGENHLEQAKNNFQKKLDFKLIESNVSRILSAFNLSKKIRRDLTSICIQVIDKKYTKSRENLIKIYSSYQEMFEYYSPSMVIVPGYAHPFYQTIYGLAKSKKIPTLMIQDGYSFYFDKYNFPRDKSGNRQTFDYCATMSGAVEGVYKNVFRNRSVKTLRIFPPVVTTHKLSNQNSKNGKVIIMFPHGMLYTPSCMWDQRYRYILDVIGVLKSLNFVEIQIKIKEGDNLDRAMELKLMKNLMHEYGYLNVEFISGRLSKYLPTVEFIIGYLGTAIIESVYAKVPYYVYEPEILGMSDHFIHNATILNHKDISRNITNLRVSIANKKYINFNEKDVFSGIHIEDIDYLKIIEDFQRGAKLKV